MAMTNAEKQAKFKEGKRATGFVQMQVWVKPADKARVNKYISRIAREK